MFGAAKAIGARNLPYHGAAANQIWRQLVPLAHDLTAWLERLAVRDRWHRAATR